MNKQELSETVIGGVIGGEVNAHLVNPTSLAFPYPDVLEDLKAGADASDLMDKYGYQAIDAAIQAGSHVSWGKGIKWVELLDQASVREEVGVQLTMFGRKLEGGEEVDSGKLVALVSKLGEKSLDFTPLSKIEPEKNVWLPTYYEPIDKYMGGMPKDSLILIAAPPGTGKTSLLVRMMAQAAKKKKKVGFFSLEMTMQQIAMRMLEIDNSLTAAQKEFILMSDEITGPWEVYAKAGRLAAAHKNLYCIAIDFADLMVEEEQSEQVMGRIYRMMAKLAKTIRVPVILLCQLSDKYVGGLPRVNHIRYSRMADAMAAMILLLYNPDQIWVDMGAKKENNPLAYYPDTGYIIQGKSRFGFSQGGVGAVRVEWGKQYGWGTKAQGWTQLIGGVG
jgi:hypothetical protein